MCNCIVAALAGVALTAGLVSAGSGPSTQPARVVQMKHLRVDLTKRTVTIDAAVCQPTYALEFLLCQGEGKTYESLLTTAAQPSHVHAALLLLGLTPGKPARWSSEGEGRFIPPRGAELTIAFHWKDKDGRAREADASDWLTSPAKDKSGPAGGPENGVRSPRDDIKGTDPIRPPPGLRAIKTWVFVGSEVWPSGRYAADQDGGIICVANLREAVIDVPFESANALEGREFAPNAAAVPPAGTPVEVVLTPLPGAANAPDARVMLEIDRLGNLVLDGRPIAPTQLRAWAEKYVEKHARGEVTLRAAAEAQVNDLAAAKRGLEFGGVRYFEEQFLPPLVEVPPRTPDQAKRLLADWTDRFRRSREFDEYLVQDAQETLAELERRTAEARQYPQLLDDYRRQLVQGLEAYRARFPTTRPEG
jgi:hypothetical protein